MTTIDYDGRGERPILANPYTAMVYEQEFRTDSGEGRDITADVMGRVDIRRLLSNFDEDGREIAVDYTLDEWTANMYALWAMLKSAHDCAPHIGEPVPENVPSFKEWAMSVGPLDMPTITRVVREECQRGFFRAGAAVSEETSDE